MGQKLKQLTDDVVLLSCWRVLKDSLKLFNFYYRLVNWNKQTIKDGRSVLTNTYRSYQTANHSLLGLILCGKRRRTRDC